MPSDGIRLQKYLSGFGVGSRRKLESWISEGKITVNGVPAELGQRVTPNCRININGRQLKTNHGEKSGRDRQRAILYNKPEGEICTRSDPKNRPTVFQNLPKLKSERWVAVGRLDINTRGLMLFTNDGDLAHKLMHPALEIEREYLCRVFGPVSSASMEKLKKGLKIDGQLIQFHNIRRQKGEGANTWYSVTVKEGKYREVRRMWEKVGCKLSRLARIRYGKVALPRGLKLGGWINLEPDLITTLVKNRDTDKVITPRTPKTPQGRSRRR